MTINRKEQMNKKAALKLTVGKIIVMVLAIIVLIVLIWGFSTGWNIKSLEDEINNIKETSEDRISLGSSSNYCKSSPLRCKTTINYYAKGKFVNCSLKTIIPFPEDSISGQIKEVKYEIDQELFLKTARDRKYPIVCGFIYKSSNYGYSNRFVDEGEYCLDKTIIDTFDSLADYKAVCCFEGYCTDWGNSFNICDCDDSLNNTKGTIDIICDTPEGEEYKC